MPMARGTWLKPWLLVPAALALMAVSGIAVGRVATAAEITQFTTNLISERNGSCLSADLAADRTAERVRQSPCDATDRQSWRFVRAVTGGYTATNLATGRCLTVDNGPQMGSPLSTRNCTGTAGQWFALGPNGGIGGALPQQLIVARSRQCVTAGGGPLVAAVNPVQWPCVEPTQAAAAGQGWRLGLRVVRTD